MTDPLTGKTVNAQLGSDRRLKTIFRVNMRSAYQKGQYERAMASDLHPYLMYRIGPSVHHREDHQSWDGLILRKDDPWWDSHLPPNGWGCKCYTRAITEARKKQYEENGIPTAPRLDGTGGDNVKAKTQAPPVKYRTYVNKRKGTVEQVPEGVDPAFNWNQGKTRDKIALQKLEESKRNYEKAAGVKPEADLNLFPWENAKTFDELHKAANGVVAKRVSFRGDKSAALPVTFNDGIGTVDTLKKICNEIMNMQQSCGITVSSLERNAYNHSNASIELKDKSFSIGSRVFENIQNIVKNFPVKAGEIPKHTLCYYNSIDDYARVLVRHEYGHLVHINNGVEIDQWFTANKIAYNKGNYSVSERDLNVQDPWEKKSECFAENVVLYLDPSYRHLVKPEMQTLIGRFFK
ncbi:MAG: phage head morphogenesis protein [Spirochaetota bacterium]|jgi:hypothetical protein|nr:phage head morphogenesis protein [Spirochaetota bacterium]